MIAPGTATYPHVIRRGATMRRQVMGLVASLLAVVGPARAQEVIEYYGTDALGSVRVVFDATGTVVGRTDYVPFGDALNPSGALPPEQFTGQERNGDAGLDYFGARYYAARFGRFSTVDPIGGHPADPQSWNRYAYARNAPGTFVDPTGMTPECPQGHYCENVTVTAGWPTIVQIPYFRASSLMADIERDGNIPSGTHPILEQDTEGYWMVDEKGNLVPAGGGALETIEAIVDLINAVDVSPVSTVISMAVNGAQGDVGGLMLAAAGFILPGVDQAKGAAKLVSSAEALYPKLAGVSHLHHVTPKYLGGSVDGKLVRIPAAYHQLITNEFRALAPYGQRLQRTTADVQRILEQVYSKFPLP